MTYTPGGHAVQFYGDMKRTYEDAEGRQRSHLHRDPMKLMRFLYSPDVLSDLETHLAAAERAAVSDKVRSRLALIRLEFHYLRHIATVAHLGDAYCVSPSYDSRERLLEAVDDWNTFLATLFVWDEAAGHWRPGMRRAVVPGWPEHRPFLGHSRHAVALTRDRHAAAYEHTPLNWDPAAMRRAPLPGALRLSAAPATAPVSLDSDAWAKAHAIQLAAQLGSPDGQTGPPRNTMVQALYDSESLYLRIESELPDPAPEFGQVVRAADAATNEALEIVLDPSALRQQFYRFIAGPSPGSRYEGATGLVADQYHPLFGQEDPAWTGDWACETLVEPARNRWLAMIRIPYATLGAAVPAAGSLWRGNFGRTHVAASGEPDRTIWSARPQTRSVLDRDAWGEIVFADP